MPCVFSFQFVYPPLNDWLSCMFYVDSFNIKENFENFKMFGPWGRNFNTIFMRMGETYHYSK